MNTSCALRPLSVMLPQYAIKSFMELAATLCRQAREKDDSEWVTVEPLPDAIRPGKLLRAARLRADMTQAELARKIAVPQAHISQYERNTRKVPAAKANELARILETSAEYFLN